MEPCTALPRRAGDSNWAHSRSRASQFVGSAPQNPKRSINHGWAGQATSFGQVVTCADSTRYKDDHVTSCNYVIRTLIFAGSLEVDIDHIYHSEVRPFGNICARCGLFVLHPQPAEMD